MNFDYIIASGDSFTEGCKNILQITEPNTWPGLLGKQLGIPWANLAEGGSCNYTIALQPVLHINDWCTKNPGQKPLLIFGFTIDDRIPYYDYRDGKLSSFYSPDPEYIKNSEHWILQQKVLLTNSRAGLDSNHNYISKCNIERDGSGVAPVITGFHYQTIQAIQVAMNYKNLFKGAEVMWGFIHSHASERDIDDKFCMINEVPYKIKYPHMDHCFNRFLNNKPLQFLTRREETWISKRDCHPNLKGIELYKDFFADVISKI